MKQDRKTLENLQRLTQISLDAELSKLAQIKRLEEPIRQKVKELEADQASRREHLKDQTGFDLAATTGVDQAWSRWAEKQKRDALQDLAKVAEQREQQLARTQRAFGQNEALTRLSETLRQRGSKS